MSLPQIRLYTLIQKHEDPYSFAQDAMHLMRNGKLVLKVRGASSARELIIMFNRVKQRPGNANQMANEEANLLNILSEVSTVDKSIKPGITAAQLKLPPALSFKTRQVKAKQATGGPFGGESFPTYTIWEIDDHKHLLTRNQETLLRNAGWVSYQGVWTKDQIVRSSTQKEEFVDIVKGWSESEEIFLNPKPNEIRDILAVLKSAGGDVVRAFIDSKKVYMWAGKAVIHNAVADMLHIPNSMIPVYLAFGKNGQKIERVSLSGRALSARDTKLSERDLTIIGKNKWINLRLDDHATFSSPSDLDTIFVGPKLQPYKEFLRRPIGEEFVDIVKERIFSEEVYKNPTTREMKDILKESEVYDGIQTLRAIIFPNDLYVWPGVVTHAAVIKNLELRGKGKELYLKFYSGQSKIAQVESSITASYGSDDFKFLKPIAKHSKLKPFITPETFFLHAHGKIGDAYTTKELFGEEFVDFVGQKREEIYKNPTTREFGDILNRTWATFARGGLRAIVDKKDIYVWAGNYMHGDVRDTLPRGTLSTAAKELYLDVEKGKSTISEVQLSITYFRHVSTTEARNTVNALTKHPWIKKYITPETQLNDGFVLIPVKDIQ